MRDDPNLYYRPEDQDCTMLAALDQAGSYQFNMVIFVKRNSDGAVFTARDAGCSCPTPFDGMTVEHAERVRTPGDVERAVMRWWDREPLRWNEGVTLSACRALIDSVSEAL